MSSLLKSTLNTRALPIGELRYIRSDAPLMLTDEEVRWLLSHNITTLVDLRSSEEVERKPCPLKELEGFTYYHLPVAGGGGTPKSREHLHEVPQTRRHTVNTRTVVILNMLVNLAINRLWVHAHIRTRFHVLRPPQHLWGR